MERLHALALALHLMLICIHLQSHQCYCQTCQDMQSIQASGLSNQTAAVGDTLALSCNFSQPLGTIGAYAVRWKHANSHRYVGRCAVGDRCYNENATKYTLTQRDWQYFELGILDVQNSNSGLYECDLEFYREQNVHVVEVSVVASPATKIPPVSTFVEESPMVTKHDYQKYPSTKAYIVETPQNGRPHSPQGMSG